MIMIIMIIVYCHTLQHSKMDLAAPTTIWKETSFETKIKRSVIQGSFGLVRKIYSDGPEHRCESYLIT